MNKQKESIYSQKVFKLKTAIVFLTLAVFIFGLALPVLALETGINYGTYTGLGTQDIRISIMKVVRVALGFVGVVAIIIIIYGGFVWMTSAGNAERIETAKKILTNAVIGLIIIFSAFAIVSFIIGALEGATGIPTGPPAPPPSGCENCGHLGTGIIESVYPVPLSRDVARNTDIMVTFKVDMKPETIVKECTGLPCSGELISDNVKIFISNLDEDANNLGDNEVIASTDNGRTFVFSPVGYLGDGANNIWYSVKLTSEIKKDNGDSAFPGGLNDYFLWRFEVGTFLDLDPVEVSNVFPQPDDEGDDYAITDAIQARHRVEIKAMPDILTQPRVDVSQTTPGDSDLVVNGSYNGTYNGIVTLTLNTGTTKTSASASWNPARANAPATFAIANNVLILGDGITLSFIDPTDGADQWEVSLTPFRPADTLTVAGRTYTFVAAGAAAAGNQINIAEAGNGRTAEANTAMNIADKINADNLSVDAEVIIGALPGVNLTAKIAGENGSYIVIQASDDWTIVTMLVEGEDAGFLPTANDAPDKPRNAVFVVDFNEAINPLEATADNIKVEYYDGASWIPAAGKYLLSNQYRTVEILSNTPCADESDNEIINSCGDKVFCWPFNDPDPYEATLYRVTVKAGLLKECPAGGCTDSNFNACQPTLGGSSACQGTFDGEAVFYPEARAGEDANGIVDAANNSFNGNKDTYVFSAGKVFGKADGPEAQSNRPAYSLNDQADDTGDDLVWEFYINKMVDLTPPNITEIGPEVGEAGIGLTRPIEMTFDKVMMSSSLKPGTNYRDGYCFCEEDNDCNTEAGETCNPDREKCVNEADQQFCEKDDECDFDRCVNKKYVGLIDQSAFSVGWWVSKMNLDTGIPLDTYADQTKAVINHTKFTEVTNYGAEVGSGVKDIYQNCYLPSVGPEVEVCNPDDPTECCIGGPYCCNGAAMDQAAWAASACFTGY